LRKKAGYLLVAARTFDDGATLANDIISSLGKFLVSTQGIANVALGFFEVIPPELCIPGYVLILIYIVDK
jgi:hypothetical protein